MTTTLNTKCITPLTTVKVSVIKSTETPATFSYKALTRTEDSASCEPGRDSIFSHLPRYFNASSAPHSCTARWRKRGGRARPRVTSTFLRWDSPDLLFNKPSSYVPPEIKLIHANGSFFLKKKTVNCFCKFINQDEYITFYKINIVPKFSLLK